MIRDQGLASRSLRTQSLQADLVVVGGGLSGVCAAVTAARAGIKVVLLQDRPVLGGNASSEVRLWILGATSHLGNNNRWSREGGVIDEILVENMHRNPEGNALVLDALLLDKVVSEPNITLLLNTAVHEVAKHDADTIASVAAFCSQNSTRYEVHAPLFCDASGDGVVGFLAGAAFRMGAESRDEFGEKFAPSEQYGQLLGHSMYFYSKDVGRPVKFVPPSFALKDITRIPRWRQFNTKEYGCKLWWLEYGGRRDTIHEAEDIKWELWRVVYGVWDHIKNSGQFPEAENLTLEWVGTIPGKRESRRFEGDVMLIQQDLVEQRRHADAVSFGGWAIDLHPADGVFSELPGCNQWHSKGVYQIPYRAMYSRNIRNLFLAGRIISASHVAFGSTRVMATCAAGAQAVGMAAALCKAHKLLPRELAAPGKINQLQLALQRAGHYIPQVVIEDEQDLAGQAKVTASSELELCELPSNGRTLRLQRSRAMLLPLPAGRVPRFTFECAADEPVELLAELRICSRLGHYTPDVTLASKKVLLGTAAAAARNGSSGAGRTPAGAAVLQAPVLERSQTAELEAVELDFGVSLDQAQYAMVCLMANPKVSVALSDIRLTGVLSLCQRADERVAESATQTPPGDIGVDSFEFWLPERRPKGENLALRIEPGLEAFAASSVQQRPDRPTTQPNAWVANLSDPQPWIELAWDQPREIRTIDLAFDTDFDHPMESVLMGHPERVMPFCVRHFRVLLDGQVVAASEEHHQTRQRIVLDRPRLARRLRVEVSHPSKQVPAALMGVSCHA